MKNKIQSYVGMRLGGASIEHPLSIHSASIGTRWKPRGMQLICTLVLLFTFAIGNVLGADDVYYVMLYNNITDAGVLTSSSTLNYGIVKYSASTGKYASSTEITVEGMGTSKASKYNQANISTFSTVGNWAAGSGTAYAAGGKFTALTIKLGTKTASSIKFIGYRNTSSTGEMTISETAKATAKKPSTYGNDCLLEWTGNFTGDVSVSVKDNKEHVGVFVITVPEAKYSVTYKAGDGTGDDVIDSDAKTVKAFADCSFTAPSGYEFKEWQDGSSNVVAAGATVSANMTLTAIYRLIPTKYTVTYNLNGASGDAPTETSKAEGDAFNLAAAPSWAGHAFDGWLCSADEAVKAAGSSYTMTAANTTFTAQWHEVDCKIYSLTGGIGSAVVQQANATVNDGVSLILSNSDGIIKLSPASGSFNAGDIVTISGTVGNTTKEFGVKISNAADKKATLGTASVAGTTNPMVATATLSAASDYLYICRTGGTTQTILTCEVHRACAEGTAAGLAYAEAEVNKTEGEAAFTNPLTNANSLVLDGYKSSDEEVATVNFSTGEVTIVGAGSATITANSAIQTKAGTLYAAGTASYTLTVAALPKYHVTYDLNGGSGDVAEIDHKAGEKFTLHDGVTGVTAPTNKTFINWKDQDDALFDGGAEYTMPAKNVTLTAQWAGDVYTVKFMDGETVLDTKVVEVGSHPADIEHPTKPLYTFAAWQLSGSDVNLDEVSGTKDAIVTLTARWAKAYASNADFEAYIIANKDEKEDAGKAEAYVKSLNYALSTKTGTTFDANDETNNGAYAGLKIKNAGTVLSWNVVAGKVVELKAGVMVANGSLAINSGTPATIDGGSTTSGNDNYKIHYFYSATEALYEFTTSNGSAEVIKAITMRDPYTVSFEAHGDADPSALPGQPSVTLPAATNGTASLLGWFDAETGGSKIGDAGDSYTPTANITLHAQWEDVSTDARLASIEFSAVGTLSPAFDPEVTSYTYTMPYGTAAVPTITGATSVNANAQEPEIVSQAAAWNETAVIRGVAQSGDKKTYNVTMKIEPKDGISIIKVATTGGTNKTVTGLYAGDGDVNLSSSKKMDGGKYIGFTLDGTTLQAGDRINVHTTTASSSGGSHIIFYDNMTDKNELYDTEEIGGVGNNIFTINAAMVGKATAYVYRSDADAVHKWNGYIDYIEVIRAMNPVLTAIAINGRAGEIDPLDDKHFNVTIPYEADLAALTVVPTIVRNAAHATTPEAVISNEGAWMIGDNTYRVMDKDGDYTDYTITLDRDVLKHTVSFNTHGGSAVDPVEVAHGAYLLAAPVDPTKEDYLFQGWAETEDGTIVDVTSFTITADKEFHAVWAADGAIKLLDGATVNHTNFITGVTADETVEFMGNEVHYAKFSGTVSGVNGVKDLTRVIAYNATTNKTKIQISAHNNSTSGRSILVKGLVEGASAAVDLATIALGNKEDKVSEWIEFNNAVNRTIYIMVSSSAGDVYFTQVKVIESGETPMKQAGEAGYSLNLNKGRFFGPASTDLAFEGLDARLSGDYTALNSGYAKLNATSMSFTVASDMNLVVTTNNSKTYYVTKGAAGTDNETAKTGVSEFDLTAGTWYITAGSSEVQFTNIAFALPKCEQPTVVDMESIGLCEGDAFIALTVSASVSDEGTLHYAWFKEAGATDEAVGTDAASFTPEADGEYYVIVTNQKTGYSDNSETSNTVSVEHFAAAVITTAPADVAKEVGQEATLSVVASGKNCTYQWFTCDDALGTNPVAIVPAETEASLTVTVAAGEQYYMVVVSSDCGAPVSAVAKVAEWRELTPANVTSSMTWDWTSAAWNGITGDIAFANTGVEELMSNVNAKVPCVDGENGFRADMLYGTGQYVWRSGNKFFQGTKIRFITTVPGKLVVRYRNTSGSTNTRTIKITNNGEVLPADGTNTTNSFKNTNPMVVKAGEVIIEGIASEENGMTRIEKIIFDADLDPTQAGEATLGGYERDVTEGRYGTICLPKAGVMVGASIFELAYYSAGENKIFMDQVMSGEMVAGRPYVFLPNEGVSTLGVYYTDDEAVAAGDYRGLYGYYNGTDDALQLDPGDGHYILYNNQFREVTVSHVWIDQNRAYFKIGVTGGIPTNVVAPLPGRRRMSIGAAAPQVTTGMDELNAGEAPVKVLINGELFILRGDKMFDATGRLIK